MINKKIPSTTRRKVEVKVKAYDSKKELKIKESF